ncbi:MAG: hypothetical protein HQL75_06905 [Magnetococcales bacterium]|nr:hypothetical protein [Magnetococcales bacterium]
MALRITCFYATRAFTTKKKITLGMMHHGAKDLKSKAWGFAPQSLSDLRVHSMTKTVMMPALIP